MELEEKITESIVVKQPAGETVTKVENTPVTDADNAKKPLKDALKENFESMQKDETAPRKRSYRASQNKETPEIAKATTESPQKEASPLEAPQLWPAEDREAFNKLDEASKALVLGRYKSMEADYTRKTQETADTRKSWERVSQVFEPHKAQLQQQGLDIPTATQRLIESYTQTQQFVNYFRSSPAEAIQWLAQRHGVDLSLMGEAVEIDPNLAEIKKANQSLMSKVSGLEQMFTTTQHAAAASQIEAFKVEKDAQGNLKYPNFDLVRPQMAQLVAQGLSLQDAYNEAIWAHPESRKILLEQEKAKLLQDEAKKQEEMRKKSEAARHAAGRPFGPGTVDSKGSDFSKLPLREHLKATAQELGLLS